MTITRSLSPQLVRVSDSHQRQQGDKTKTNEQRDLPKQCHQNAKRVQFVVNEQDTSSTAEISSGEPAYELCDDIKTDLWWSPEEHEQNGRERKDLAKQYFVFQDDDDVDTDFTALYTNCSLMSFTQVMRSKAAKQFLKDATSMDGLRGLEARLSKGLLSRRRKEHVSSLLSIERQLEGHADSEELLSAKSLELSRTSQILARVLAQIDARDRGDY